MPAIAQSALQSAIEAALLTVTGEDGKPMFVKKGLDGAVISPPALADGTKKLVEGLSLGIANAWTVWQATQTVTGTAAVSSAPGVAPVTGILP